MIYLTEVYKEYKNILGEGFLDTTLITAEEKSNYFTINFYGDGFILTKYKDGQMELVELEYKSNAPYYLSYLLNENRKDLYIYAYKEYEYISHITIMRNNYSILFKNDLVNRYDYRPEFYFYKEDMETIIIGSDGFGSFHDKDNNTLPLISLVPRLLDFKGYQGEFLKRRVNKLIKELNNEGYTNFDDISLAAITVKDEESENSI